MNNNLNRIPFLVRLSRMTSRVIKENLVIGGGFIVAFLALAAAGEVPAWLAAVLHVVSSLMVVFNSARLVRSGEDIEQAEHAALEARTGVSPRGPEGEAPAPPHVAVPVPG